MASADDWRSVRMPVIARYRDLDNAVRWTRLSCCGFDDNQVRLQLFALAYNLGNFLRRLDVRWGVKHWSLTTLREKLITVGAKVVYHARQGHRDMTATTVHQPSQRRGVEWHFAYITSKRPVWASGTARSPSSWPIST